MIAFNKLSFRKSLGRFQKHEKTRIIPTVQVKTKGYKYELQLLIEPQPYLSFWFRQLFLSWTTCVQKCISFYIWLAKNQVNFRNVSSSAFYFSPFPFFFFFKCIFPFFLYFFFLFFSIFPSSTPSSLPSFWGHFFSL